MLQFAGRIGLGVDVADLLQLQGAFERDRVVQAAPEEERVLDARESLAPGDDVRLEREHALHGCRQVPQTAHSRPVRAPVTAARAPWRAHWRADRARPAAW